MNPLLSIASKVEAAVEAYIAVRDFADQHIWKAGLKRELVSFHLHGDSTAKI
jgi:hypothetical protein